MSASVENRQCLARGHSGPISGTRCPRGDPITTVCEVGTRHDIIVVSSHGRKELSRI